MSSDNSIENVGDNYEANDIKTCLDKRLEALNKRGKIYNTEQEQKEFQEKYKKVWKPFSLFSEQKVDEVKTRKNRMTTKEEIQKVRNKYQIKQEDNLEIAIKKKHDEKNNFETHQDDETEKVEEEVLKVVDVL